MWPKQGFVCLCYVKCIFCSGMKLLELHKNFNVVLWKVNSACCSFYSNH